MAEEGCEVIITRNGQQVARLMPSGSVGSNKGKQRALAKLLKLLRKGAPVPSGRRFTRDEMHER